jgi:Tfp pilus assembly protein PilV
MIYRSKPGLLPLTAFVGLICSAASNANDWQSELELAAGFVPDPYSHSAVAGGTVDAGIYGAQCSGFVNPDSPALVFDYDNLNQSGRLGVFVDALIDSTLVVFAPDGSVHCNADSPDLANGNPGLEISNASSGQYRVMIGSESANQSDPDSTLVVTEYGASMWMVLDLDAGFDSLLHSMVNSGIDFGDDSGDWANDGECDDPRFLGNGSAMMPAFDHEGRDASDCRILFGMGEVELVGSATLATSNTPAAAAANDALQSNSQSYDKPEATLLAQNTANVDFGDNSSQWANDGECDDPRFEGEGMATTLVDEDRLRDANDCRALYNAGNIRLLGVTSSLAPASASNNALTASQIDFGDNSSSWSNDGECDDPRFEGEGMASVTVEADLLHDAADCRSLFEAGRISLSAASRRQLEALQSNGSVQGSLSSDDDRGNNGGYADTYSFTSNSGEQATIDLSSDDFDTYLRVTSPSGEVFVNDDFQSSTSRSLVSIGSTEPGTYTVEVTSYMDNETGNYTLTMRSVSNNPVTDQFYSGRLEQGDETLQSGEFVDTYTFSGTPGQRVRVALESNDFDTYLIVAAPSGSQEENDDAEGTNSSLVLDLTESGEYQVWVTSFDEGDSGNYALRIGGDSDATGSNATATDVASINVGDSVTGELNSSDSRAITDGPEDGFVFFGEAGDSVVIDLQSGEFDTYLTLITPDGERIENDDHDSSLQQSQIALSLPGSGRYRVIVSSYQGEGLGDYSLNIRSDSSAFTDTPVNSSEGQVFGLFVGVADYPGTDSDLPLTDQDALRARDAVIRGAGMPAGNGVTLINEDATRANFISALSQLEDRTNSDDTLVIFYSGHGSRVPRSSGYDSRDPDGYDETMVLYDGDLLDDELASMLDELSVGKVILVMDSCFSGGFAKDIVSRPGRMGLFSSEEDVLSQVASKFQAGGYLSYFFEEALTERYADRDNNGELTAIELSQYLHQRFDTDVKSFGTDQYVRAQGPQASYQKLVIDRGGVGPYNVLFTRR